MWLERRDTCLPEISDSLKQANGALRGQPEGRTKLEELDYAEDIKDNKVLWSA